MSHALVPQLEHPITRAAVLGAGSMGSGIAAHLANAGIEVKLFDMPPKDSAPGDDAAVRASRAQAGIDMQVKRRGFMRPDFAKRVHPFNIEDDLAELADVEWIVEAVFEDPTVKADIYAKVAAHRSPDSIVSSNTSTIPLADLVAGMDESMVPNFLITHFFNPPRVMRLVEVVAGPQTDRGVVERVSTVLEKQLGKVALACRDTPGFIANRIGNFWLESAASIAMRDGITPEHADALFSKPFGVPRTGIFGLLDYIGLQLLEPIFTSLHRALPSDDRTHRFDLGGNKLLSGLVERGWTGRTGESGFYKGRDLVVTDDFTYRPRELPQDPALAEKDARSLMQVDSEGGRFAWEAFCELVDYCCETAPEISDTVDSIDQAMVLGYGWQRGPFALADAVGLDWLLERYRVTGRPVPELLTTAQQAGGFHPDAEHVLGSDGTVRERPVRDGVVTVAELVRDAKVLVDEKAAAVHLLDGGIALLSLRTPMNSLSNGVFDVIEELLARHGEWGVKALLVASDNERSFSAGADLPMLVGIAADGDRAAVRQAIRRGADGLQALRFAPFPVVSAVRGVALGGGAELVIQSDVSVLHAETALGFPERTVGLLPGWGGSVQSVRLMTEAGIDDPVRSAFQVIAAAAPVPGAFELERRGLLHADDRISLSVDHVISSALELAREQAQGYQPPQPATIHRLAPGTTLEPGEGDWDDDDRRILACLARLYVAGEGEPVDVGERELSEQETDVTAEALCAPGSLARAEHMARTRRPLKK